MTAFVSVVVVVVVVFADDGGGKIEIIDIEGRAHVRGKGRGRRGGGHRTFKNKMGLGFVFGRVVEVKQAPNWILPLSVIMTTSTTIEATFAVSQARPTAEPLTLTSNIQPPSPSH